MSKGNSVSPLPSTSDDDELYVSWKEKLKKLKRYKQKSKMPKKAKKAKEEEDSMEKTNSSGSKQKDMHKSSRTRSESEGNNKIEMNVDLKMFEVLKKDQRKTSNDRPLKPAEEIMTWESKTPFVFTYGRNNRVCPPIAEAEETLLCGDNTCKEKGKLEEVGEIPNEFHSEPPSPEQDANTDRPPPLPPRGSKPPSPTDRPLGNSWPRDAGRSWNTVQNAKKTESQAVCVRSPAKRRRDHVQRRKYSTPTVIPRTPSTSSSSCSADDAMESNAKEQREGIDNTQCIRNQFENSRTGNQLEVPNIRPATGMKHSPSNESFVSCPEVGSIRQAINSQGDMNELDFQWQNYFTPVAHRSRSTYEIGVTRSESLGDQSTKVAMRSGKKWTKGHNRPHSIGYVDMKMLDRVFYNPKSQQNAQRYTENYFPKTLPNKRMPLMLSDDLDSVSDLESLMEINCRSFEVSRENSLVSDEDVAKLCGDLQKLSSNGETENGYVKVLPSPRVSPDIFHSVPGVVVTSDSEETSDSQTGKLTASHKSQNFLSVPKKIHRRRRSLSLTSGSEESDCEPSPPVARRGRRAAIVDTKNFGDVSPTNLSPEVSPCNSCDEGEGASNIAERLRRRRSSVELAMNIYPGDLLVQEHHKKLLKRNTVADFHALRNNNSTSNINSDDSKKGRQSFSLLKLMKSRSKEAVNKLEDVLANMKPTEFKDNHLAAYKILHWSDLVASSDKPTEQALLSETERKRREAVWELFKSECVFLIDHLMVLKHCFMEPLKKVQVEGHLMYAEPQDLFGNLDELCYVSYTFCKDFIAALLKAMSSTEFGSTRVLLKAFERFSIHSKDGDVYHTYCLNYTNALTYLDQLRRKDDFAEFEKWCEQDNRCNRLQLTDLLVAPMQHCTKLPLLLGNIRKYTESDEEIQRLTESIARVELSLQSMEDKMKWVKNYERVQEIQRQLSWPPVTELDSRVFIPEYLKSTLLKQPCERLLACPKRQLMHEGQLTLVESAKTTDVHLFLFDDILLITKVKKTSRKKLSGNIEVKQATSAVDKASYAVHKQPIALDRLSVHDISQSEAAANNLKCAFVIVQISRYQQIIGVFTIQCPTDNAKNVWLEKLREAKGQFSTEVCKSDSFKENKPPATNEKIKSSPENRCRAPSPVLSFEREPVLNNNSASLQDMHTKSGSADSIYI